MSGTSEPISPTTNPILPLTIQTRGGTDSMMVDVRRLEPRTPVLLADGVVLSAGMIRFIWQGRRAGCTASCLVCHFREYWNVEVTQDTIEHALRNELQLTSLTLPYGYIDVPAVQITVPAGIFYIVASCCRDPTALIKFYLSQHFNFDMTVGEIIACVTQWEASLRRDQHGVPIYPADDSIRPRPEGRRLESLPTSPLTPRLGRPRSAFEFPPPRYSPPFQHEGLVLRHPRRVNSVGGHLYPFFPPGQEPDPPRFEEIETHIDQPPAYDDEDPEMYAGSLPPPAVPEGDPAQSLMEDADASVELLEDSSTVVPSSPVVSPTTPAHEEVTELDNQSDDTGNVQQEDGPAHDEEETVRDLLSFLETVRAGQAALAVRRPVVVTLPNAVPEPLAEFTNPWTTRLTGRSSDAEASIVFERDPGMDDGDQRPLEMLPGPPPPIDKQPRTGSDSHHDSRPGSPHSGIDVPVHVDEDYFQFVLASYEPVINGMAPAFPMSGTFPEDGYGLHPIHLPRFSRPEYYPFDQIVVLDAATFRGANAQEAYEAQLQTARDIMPSCVVVMLTYPGDLAVALESADWHGLLSYVQEDASFRTMVNLNRACRHAAAPWNWGQTHVPPAVDNPPPPPVTGPVVPETPRLVPGSFPAPPDSPAPWNLNDDNDPSDDDEQDHNNNDTNNNLSQDPQ